MNALITRIRGLAARSRDDVVILAMHGPYEGVVEHGGERWILRLRDGALRCVFRTEDRLAGVCLDASGAIWSGTGQYALRIDDEARILELPSTAMAAVEDGRVFCGAGSRVWQIAPGVFELPRLPTTC